MIQLTGPLLAAFVCAASQPSSETPASGSPFQERGYYITFMRMPTFDLDDWKRIVDGIHEDGGNLLLLWMGGAFRSQKVPVTWKYNEEHQNVRQDFVRDVIDHAPDRHDQGGLQGHAGRQGLTSPPGPEQPRWQPSSVA